MKMIIALMLIPVLGLTACGGSGDANAGAADFGGGTGSSGGSGTSGAPADPGSGGGDGDPTTAVEGADLLGSALRISTGRDRFLVERISADLVTGLTSQGAEIDTPEFDFVGEGSLDTGFLAGDGARYDDDGRFSSYDHLNVLSFSYTSQGTDFSGLAVLGTPTPLAEVPNAGSTGSATYTGEAVFTYQNRENGGAFPTWEVETTSRVQVGFASRAVTATIDIDDDSTVTTSGGATGLPPFDRIEYYAEIDGNRFKLPNEAAFDVGLASTASTGIDTSNKNDVIGPSTPPGGLGGTGVIEGVFYGTNDATNQPAEVGATFLSRGNIGVVSGALAAK